MSDINKPKKQTQKAQDSTYRVEDDTRSQTSEIMDTEFENMERLRIIENVSRMGSGSSCHGSTRSEAESKKGQKRKKM